MERCVTEGCGSFAINDHQHGRIKGIDLDLCDVCYWRTRAELLGKVLTLSNAHAQYLKMLLDEAAELMTRRMAKDTEAVRNEHRAYISKIELSSTPKTGRGKRLKALRDKLPADQKNLTLDQINTELGR